MRPLRLSPLLFRRIHKWIGLALGLQLLLWTLSGAMMALLDRDVVGGHAMHQEHVETPVLPAALVPLEAVGAQLDGRVVVGLAVRRLLDHPVFQVETPDGTHLVDAITGRRLTVDAALARDIARASYGNDGRIRQVSHVPEPTLENRGHAGGMWRVDFADDGNTSIYVSDDTAEIHFRRNDTWRLWDFFWMLHNMDYVERESFNHPLIVVVAFGVLWLAVTGLYLLFKSFRRAEFRWMMSPGRRFRARTVKDQAG
jgi:uncharacterized iron-regulated membrane protein